MTDRLDRGLVAVKTSSGIWCSWRVLAEEYYDVKYNIYRDGTKLNDQPLEVTNFGDSAGGTENSQYTVTAVVNGVESGQSKPAAVWTHNYLEITPDHGDLKSTYVPNDACCADVDGDGEVEILMKYDNQSEINASYPKGGYQGEYSIAEVFKLDGTKLWWLDFGPNMGDFQNNEQNIVAYDWDGDGRAEALIRAADGTTIHAANGETYVIGDASKNYRGATGGGSNWFMHQGAEYLVYMDGATGVPYQVMDYPLKRLEAGETDLEKAWGDGYGHRSTKHFFGAPCLDGRKASIFLARGIYTRHKMIAFDVDPATHQLTERWRWVNNTPGSPWYGQGYHNYSIADVDWDGRDEICFGSMVIDDNGHGLSTTGLGHGDAHHVGDFNPYIHGQELFACNEDNPSNNYRDATTSKIYYRRAGGDDDGRCMAGNFTNDYPGAMAFSAHDEPISCVTADHVSGLTKTGVTDNFRIYWDGDLLEETLNYTSQGKNTAVTIYKYGRSSALQTLTGSMTNNDTKGTPCYQGDILGDWREEVIARTKDNKVRIYTTTIPTEWRNYSLWYDHQYRNAMVWQMCGYNQPPHVSYFLGEIEEITVAPPPLTMTDRQEIGNGETIGIRQTRTDTDAKASVILCEPNDMTVSVADGAGPSVFYDNAPSWVQGHDNNSNITTEYFTHTLTGGAFTGDMRLVKQGDGILVLPKVTENYTGPTDIWAGTLRFDGTMQNSPVWLNRFAVLESDGGKFRKEIRMDYGSELRPGGKDRPGSFEAEEIWMRFGSRIVFDVMSDGSADCIKTNWLCLMNKDWENGPKYSTPVFEIVRHGELAEGKYLLMEASEILYSSLDDIVLEGVDGLKTSLTYEDGKIYLNVDPLRAATNVAWDGGSDGIWDLADTENFILADGQKDFFVTGDVVTFGDEASQTKVTVSGDVAPSEVIFDNETAEYTLRGDGSIIGDARFTKRGAGRLTISNTNRMTGGVAIEGGTLAVSALANTDGTEYGALGGVDNPITFSHHGTMAVSATTVSSQKMTVGEGGGAVYVSSGRTLTVNGAISQTGKSRLTKDGGGTMIVGGTVKLDTLCVNQGVVQGGENNNSAHQYPSVIVLNGGTLKDPDNIYSYSSNKATVIVPEGKTAVWTLDARCDYKGKLLGGGTLTVNVTSVRSNMQGDWSQFTGTLKFAKTKTGSYDPLIQWNNNYGLGKATVTGEFDNGGKDVTIGTLSDKATLTGSGRYTVKHIDATITRSRSGLSSTYFEVQGTLAISGEITVTLRGNELKAADRVTLWKAGALQTTSNANVVVNLPDLPDGLYWDTSELLKKEGVLKVTDKPTGIDNGQLIIDNYDGAWFTLDGRRLQDKPTQKGLYIRNGKKVIVK